MIVFCSRKPQTAITDAPEQTKSAPRKIKVIKAGTSRTVPVPTEPKQSETKSESQLRDEWVKAKDESKRSAYKVAMAFFFDVPDVSMSAR